MTIPGPRSQLDWRPACLCIAQYPTHGDLAKLFSFNLNLSDDNILKIIADSLNQIAYKDDAQVVDTQVRKFYSRRPRVAVVIRSAAATESSGGGETQ